MSWFGWCEIILVSWEAGSNVATIFCLKKRMMVRKCGYVMKTFMGMKV